MSAEIVNYDNNFPNPIAEIPVLHNYAYGPVWLLITSAAFVLSQQNIFWFAAILKATVVTSIAGIAYLTQKLVPNGRTINTLILIGLNPVVIIFAFGVGQMEMVQSLLLVFSLLLLSKQQFWAGTFLLMSAVLVKLNLVAILPLIFVWIVRNRSLAPFHQRVVRTTLEFGLSTGLLLLVVSWLWGLGGHLTQGIWDFLSIERAWSGGFSGFVSFLITGFMPQSERGFALGVVQSIATTIVGIVIAYHFTKFLVRKQPLTELISACWLILLLVIFLSGAIVKPWYIVTPLVLSVFLSPKEQYFTVITSIFFILGTLALHLVLYFNPLTISAYSLTATSWFNVLPFLLLIITVFHRSNPNNPIPTVESLIRLINNFIFPHVKKD